MKIRKVNLAIASALMMAGSAAAIAPASAVIDPDEDGYSITEYGRDIERDFPAHWRESVERCVKDFGEAQRILCGYHAEVHLSELMSLSKDDTAGAELFGKLANKAWVDLYAAAGIEGDTETPFD